MPKYVVSLTIVSPTEMNPIDIENFLFSPENLDARFLDPTGEVYTPDIRTIAIEEVIETEKPAECCSGACECKSS